MSKILLRRTRESVLQVGVLHSKYKYSFFVCSIYSVTYIFDHFKISYFLIFVIFSRKEKPSYLFFTFEIIFCFPNYFFLFNFFIFFLHMSADFFLLFFRFFFPFGWLFYFFIWSLNFFFSLYFFYSYFLFFSSS